ncbi:SCO2400 family protein [Streptacidiphilus jiangxiensis]|uniref:Uncharacterized protein n=1 Tax=Streptacidiphilus jiangxiensis TaxID=235985 RepID=A0A1H7UWQ7_STRJI|nr:hypothetical protein [Streptacidiphilus jiangxiensis]SEM01264.1 hypothetical protein SAMN05414137_116215 [Streptacidiphilus jiangxiensis]
MKFCPTCRRHLNGAYSCPGCGTAAADLPTVPPTEATGVEAARTVAYSHPGELRATEPGADESRRGGRAEQREQQRRRAAKRRRGVLLGGVGVLVIAAAGVAMANVSGNPGPPPLDAGSTAGGASATAPDGAVPSVTPTASSAGDHRRATHHPHPSASASATASASARPTASRSPAPGSSGGTGSTGGASTAGSGTDGGTTGGTPSTKPSPSSTCHPILFWCG